MAAQRRGAPRRADPSEMTDFNVLTFSGRSFPGTAPLLVGKGERVRIRLGNFSPMDHHPIHWHGLSFRVTATDGGYIPEQGQTPETTVLVPTGSARVIEFVPEEAGDWAMHCHMTHHVMTQMGAMEMPIPSDSLPTRGAPDPFGYIDMGGMFTMLKVRDEPAHADPAGWYAHPKGSVAGRADPGHLRADGIVLPEATVPSSSPEHSG